MQADLPHIVDIYNAAVPTRHSTADMEPVTAESCLEWFRKHTAERRQIAEKVAAEDADPSKKRPTRHIDA